MNYYIRNAKLLSSDELLTGAYKINENLKYKFPAQLYSVVRTGYFAAEKIKALLGYCIHCNREITNELNKTNKANTFLQYAKSRTVKFFEGDKYICLDCFNNSRKFGSCDICHEIYKIQNLESGLCINCINKVPKRFINNYTFKVEDEYSNIGTPKDGIFFGVELEYEARDYAFDVLKVNENIQNFAFFKKDASIERGFEIVSAPCSLEAHHKIWDKFFNNLPPTVQIYRTCGMHVHATRSRLTNLQIGKMLVFLHSPNNKHFIEIIAERKSNTQNNFEIFKKIGDGKNGGMLPQNGDRHTALNLNNHKTIEFRIFNSPKNKKTLLKNIEFCKALIKFTGMGEHSISESKNSQIFCNFIRKYKKEYVFLFRFLMDKKLI